MPAENPFCQLCDATVELCPQCDFRDRFEKASSLAGELIALIRINVMRGTFATATVKQIDEFLAPRIEQLKELRKASPRRGQHDELPQEQQQDDSEDPTPGIR